MDLTGEYAVQLRCIDAEVLHPHVGKDIAEFHGGSNVPARVEIRLDERRREARRAMIEAALDHASEYKPDRGFRMIGSTTSTMCIALKMAILRISSEGHSKDRLFNPTEWRLRDESRLFRTARLGWRNQQGRVRMQKTALHQFYLFVSR